MKQQHSLRDMLYNAEVTFGSWHVGGATLKYIKDQRRENGSIIVGNGSTSIGMRECKKG